MLTLFGLRSCLDLISIDSFFKPKPAQGPAMAQVGTLLNWNSLIQKCSRPSPASLPGLFYLKQLGTIGLEVHATHAATTRRHAAACALEAQHPKIFSYPQAGPADYTIFWGRTDMSVRMSRFCF